MEFARRTLKSVITTLQHLLEIKVKKKALNSQNISESQRKITSGNSLKSSLSSKTRPYVCGSREWDLCLTDKFTIIKADPECLLNTGDGLVSKYRHMNKFTLKYFKKKLLITHYLIVFKALL